VRASLNRLQLWYFRFINIVPVSKSDSQQLSIMGFVLLDTPAALLVALVEKTQPKTHPFRETRRLVAQICSNTAAPKRKAVPS
jgi:hypothetical protein